MLLTYKCTLKCDHCFTWGSPWQCGTMTLPDIQLFLEQAKETGSIEQIAFEGGEPFLYYATLLAGTRKAVELGLKVNIVTNAFWAISEEDALACLRPFKGLLNRLSVSSDVLHWQKTISSQARFARTAAESLDIPMGYLSTAHPLTPTAECDLRELPNPQGSVMYRGRAAQRLAPHVSGHPWTEFTTCPCENLREPSRVHLDPFGNLLICQGISLGNLFDTPLKEICKNYNYEQHPITSALVVGGPAELVRRYQLPHSECYADACHLCDTARRLMRQRFPDILTPDQMYGTNEQPAII